MINYILQIIIFQVLFLAVYDFFLSKETFHTHNRWYLLGTPILSFVLPLIKIPTFQKAMPQEIMILLPEVMLSPQKVIEQTTFYTDGSINYLNLLFWVGVALFTGVFMVKLFRIIQLITKNETIKKYFYKLILLPKENSAFSFFNYIFLGKDIPKEKQEAIIEHELIHA
ncbi:MAG: bla regulator protein BlaR1, partial [Polaribacter sp.]